MHRAYHNLQHIADCLAELDDVETPAGADAIELAIWYHDVVYDTHAIDNEVQSADWADRDLMQFDQSEETRSTVRRLILATQHTETSEEDDEALLISIDLSTLGKSRERYIDYATAIRREYAWVPEADFAIGRAKVLQSFLDRDTIFPHPQFKNRYEAQARANLNWELDELR
ncbi:MAG: hypothetical protein AAF585_09025 [Verrucomicrobiota bacterium]